MNFTLPDALDLLSRTPATLRALLANLPDHWLHANYGDNTFSPYDVVGHLITGENTDWLTRARLILDHGTSTPFSKYDRYAQFETSHGKSIADLLNEFERLRHANLVALRSLNLSAADLQKKGLHPALGEVTLENLLATWVAHDLNHIAQIAKAMATQYQDAIGPWREYLGILRSPVTQMDPDGAARKARTTA